MVAQTCIAIYGRSLFGLAMEATLTEQTNIQVIHIHCGADLVDKQDVALIIVEANDFASLPSPCPSVPVLLLDVANGRMTIVQREQRPIHNMNELVIMITNLVEAPSAT